MGMSFFLQLWWYNCELSWSQECLFLVWYLVLVPESFTGYAPMSCVWGFWHGYPYSSNTNDFSCYSFLQEPFKSIPLIWIVHENALAYRSRQYTTNGQIELLNDWGRVFNRSTVVVFPNYALPVRCMGQIIYLMFWYTEIIPRVSTQISLAQPPDMLSVTRQYHFQVVIHSSIDS